MLYDSYYREQIQLEEFHGPKQDNFNAWRGKKKKKKTGIYAKKT